MFSALVVVYTVHIAFTKCPTYITLLCGLEARPLSRVYTRHVARNMLHVAVNMLLVIGNKVVASLLLDTKDTSRP